MEIGLIPRASFVIKSLDQFIRTRGQIFVTLNDDPTVSVVLIEARAGFDSSGAIEEYRVCILEETDGLTIDLQVGC